MHQQKYHPLRKGIKYIAKYLAVTRHVIRLAIIGSFLLIPLQAHADEELSHHLSPVPPRQAADFTLQDMDDKTHSLKDYRGKVIMLNFWATWCPPCRKEMPSMESIYQKFKKQGFVILAINQWESPDIVFVYTGELSVTPTFPILFDRKGNISGMFGVKGLPTTVLLNRKGQVVFRAIGGRNFNHPDVYKVIRTLLSEK